ncbi:glycoside hydrolase family 2 protein [Sanguibacter antarcticus]|uniref:beta-mannosidase n=1 Tax=Sanguibacter antarcticus TaxID=372484 RepID=A0A2A9E1B7_9MICO|nr:sugar-binding domain-containing protein [Sanguibacter antarcticus]PFG32633.1 beta-mannosidase [Sanguibacter antarcticus]
MISETLHDGWTLRATHGPVPAEISGRVVPAEVPGTAHTALMAVGLVPDPYLDLNERHLAWMHRTAWRYELTFRSHPATVHEQVDLAFDGIDTVARVRLNGTEIGRTANQHRSYRFDVTALVREGENHLVVDLRPAIEYAHEQAAALGLRPRAYDHPFNMVRKMACSFGWDWGPDLQTAGLWKPVRLERWVSARLAQVRPLVTVDEHGTGHIHVHVDIEHTAEPGLEHHGETVVTAALAEGHGLGDHVATVELAPGARSAVVHLDVPGVPLWWPAGYGEHPLFTLEVVLGTTDGGRLDTYTRRVGFRTVEIDTAPDEIGTPFTLVVNGERLFVKGANWIPDDHLLTRITRERLARRVDQALDANMNLLRVWGGGIYESEDFYDVCDERGVMVWQDFLLACAAYPEEEPLWSELEAEARENVARLTPHASLVVWNGGNENLWGFVDWDWQDDLAGRTWGHRYYTELFPAILAELDPTRPYCDGSPYSPGFSDDVAQGTPAVHPNDANHGTRHEWEVWNRQDYSAYLDVVPRFCSEFGFQGPPTWTTLTRSIPASALHKDSPEFLLHQKAEDGNAKLDRGLAPHLGVPERFEDWHWATQLNQAHAVQLAIEHFRSWWPRTAGAIVWQLNDCWPVTSWAAIDGDERPKPLFYALRHAYADRLLTVQQRDGAATLVVVNDSAEPWVGTVLVRRAGLDGAELARVERAVDVAPRSTWSLTMPTSVTTAVEPSHEVVVAELDGVRTVHALVEPKDRALDPGALGVVVRATDTGVEIVVCASSLAVDVAVMADRISPEAVVDDMLVTLLAGESRTFSVTTAEPVDAARVAELSAPGALDLVLRSANALVQHPTDGRR